MNESDREQLGEPHPYDDEIDLSELFSAVWEGKILIILITSIIAIGSVIYSLSLENYYRSEAVLVAEDSQSSGGLSQYSGLASLAGIRMPSKGSDPVVEMKAIVESREFVKHLMTFKNVLPSMMATKSYNLSSQEIYFDPKIYNVENATWVREPSNNKRAKPSYLETHKAYIDDMLSISQDSDTGLISMSIEHISPIFAKDFLALIIKEANNLKRKKDIDTSSKALSYLKLELSQTPLVEMKESINQLIEAQLEIQMMAKINEEYSLVIIEPPFIPEVKSKPTRSFIVVFATIFGGLLSTMIVLIRHYFLVKE